MSDFSDGKEAKGADLLQSSELSQRLLRRQTSAHGLINVRQPQEMYARTTEWVAQRFSLLDELRSRYDIQNDFPAQGQAFTFGLPSQEQTGSGPIAPSSSSSISSPAHSKLAQPSPPTVHPSSAAHNPTGTLSRQSTLHTPSQSPAAPSTETGKFRISRRPRPAKPASAPTQHIAQAQTTTPTENQEPVKASSPNQGGANSLNSPVVQRAIRPQQSKPAESPVQPQASLILAGRVSDETAQEPPRTPSGGTAETKRADITASTSKSPQAAPSMPTGANKISVRISNAVQSKLAPVINSGSRPEFVNRKALAPPVKTNAPALINLSQAATRAEPLILRKAANAKEDEKVRNSATSISRISGGETTAARHVSNSGMSTPSTSQGTQPYTNQAGIRSLATGAASASYSDSSRASANAVKAHEEGTKSSQAQPATSLISATASMPLSQPPSIIWRKAAADAGPNHSMNTIGSSNTNIVARESDNNAAAAGPVQSNQPASINSDGQAEESQIDVGRISEQVLRAISRRLAVERERRGIRK